MGQRPPRRGPPAPARPIEVVRLPRRSPPLPPSGPLPPAVLAALGSIAGDLRNLPRDCIRDPAELLHWLRRMAGRVDGVGQMRVVGAVPLPARPPALPRPATPRELAEAVFGKAPALAPPGSRTIIDPRGRPVRVEARRARAAGQMEMPV